MQQVTDNLETMILMAMDANVEKIGQVDHYRYGKKVTGIDPGEALGVETMMPHSAYTWDMVDSDRLVATTVNGLVNHPFEIIGDQTETILLLGDAIRWFGLRRISRPPRGVCCAGKASFWYELHSRIVRVDGFNVYQKRIVPLSYRGIPIPAMFKGCVMCSPLHEGKALIQCASAIEDAHRANTMLAAVKDATEIKFPVPIADYKTTFAEREGPMNGSRRKAILHWVSKHLRNSTRGKEHAVKRYTRGVQEFTIDGLRIRLSPNTEREATSTARTACGT